MDDHTADDALFRETGGYFRSLVEASTQCIRVLTAEGRVEFMNQRGQQLFEIDDFNADRGRLWPDLWPTEEQSRLWSALDAARQGRVTDLVGFCPTAKGAPRWWRTSVAPVLDEAGQVVRILATSEDVSAERKLARQRSRFVNELNHRVKNTLAAVQSIVGQSLRNARVAPEVRQVVEARILSLSRTQNLLNETDWESAPLKAVILTALCNLIPEGRWRLSGPDLALRPGAAATLGMAVHELGLNACAHGAWSGRAGRVEVFIRQESDHLTITWVEHEGPSCIETPERRGFGSRMLEAALPGELGAEVEMGRGAAGLTCTIVLPIERIVPTQPDDDQTTPGATPVPSELRRA